MPILRLLLFDIDQTLIYTAGAGMRSLRRAVLDVTSVGTEDSGVQPDGKTDPMILEEMLRAAGLPPERYEADIWRQYAQYLGDELAREDSRRAMKPGVPELLQELHRDARACLGLLTGNLEQTARIKLAAFDLNRYFPVGAYGSDCPDRCALGKVALERAREHWGTEFDAHTTWVIGDTSRDVQAARSVGARALAVATGRMTVEQLRETDADAVLPDLSDTAEVLRILLDR